MTSRFFFKLKETSLYIANLVIVFAPSKAAEFTVECAFEKKEEPLFSTIAKKGSRLQARWTFLSPVSVQPLATVQ